MFHRRLIVCLLSLAVVCVSAACQAQSSAAPAAAAEAPKAFRVYVGTYTGPQSKGIYMMRLDLSAGTLSEPELAGQAVNPSFLALHPSGKYLYCAGEIGTFAGKKSGAVSAFAVGADGKLTALNQQPSGGVGPCHVSVDPQGKNLLSANYGSGSVGVAPIGPDGKLGEPTCSVQHEGRGANPKRQTGPHAHSINLDQAGRFAFAADLGIDKIMIYRLDSAAGKLTPNDPPFAQVAPGAGPRHFAFHPSGKYAYVINELDCTVTAFACDAEAGKLTAIESVTTLPKDFTGTNNTTAEVQVHPSGRFLYGSNRGHDSIAIFRIDQATGKLTPAGHEPSGGKTPRNFGIDPTGRYLLTAHQGSGNLVLFRIDPETGLLKPTGATAQVPSAVCVKFLACD